MSCIVILCLCGLSHLNAVKHYTFFSLSKYLCVVNLERLVSDLGHYPIALVGCHSNGTGYPTCVHDIIIFDEKIAEPSAISTCNGQATIIHHGSINESRSRILAGYSTIGIIQDDTMVLAPLIQKIKSDISGIFLDCARNSLTDSMICTARSLDASTPVMEACWQKCANIHLCDAVLALNRLLPSTHTLEHLRGVDKYSDTVVVASSMWGIERASTTLLNRMSKAVVGMQRQQLAKIIQYKTDILLQEQRLADCYYYLCRQASIAMSTNLTHHEFVYSIAIDASQASKDNTSLIRREIKHVLKILSG